MFIFNGAILGLGLFFLGLQLTGQNMRALSGGGFRQLARRATGTQLLSGVCGLVAGALMQSATAVTFILVSMTGSGLVQTASARMVVVWCNVGLTALAFLAAFNIHPVVAFIVGVAGIAMGSVRQRPWNTIAGAVLGVGIILFGLEQIGSGLAPLKDEAWFRQSMEAALHSPLLAFGTGIAAAALLQSNAGAAMVLITLAAGGATDVESAAPAIYGTNLGAIVLRAFLARGLGGSALRLVRMEDLFCVLSGVLMMSLLFLEKSGVPLVLSLVSGIPGGPAIHLAWVFLLSNLIPAIVVSPFLPICETLLQRIWPSGVAERPDEPLFLRSQALADPETALDLIPKELGRLFASVKFDERPADADVDSHQSPEFIKLGAAIESFCVKLASENPLSSSQSLRLQRCRAWLHTIRHIGEAAGELAATRYAIPEGAMPCAEGLLDWLRANISLGAEATASMDERKIQEFFESSKPKVPTVRTLRKNFLDSCGTFPPVGNLEMASLVDQFDIIAWLVHRLSKLQVKAIQEASGLRVTV